ncbi:hypothetical protein GTPT_1598 [Tatumella ptyseos ATCC 33301]|uniref:Uncharacterized protein n=2 Tax=Tatumella ptyseos TaxID=82987 RepID=A0A085JGS1_9GAMM|nr:hypothetical protein [Tatumella ptyseos]KFD19667.1 hypothetical protein GTPT_1598 [Tatumella ptyseos ATCC 33301]SQK75776.1 Uncharacterised protein [Tatumella ptyseos]
MSLNLKIECSGMHTGWQARPGKYNFELEDCQIEPLTREQQMELCAQMEFDWLVEYVNSFAEVKNVA